MASVGNNPDVISLAADTWVKAIEGVTVFVLRVCDSAISKAPSNYLWTYRQASDSTAIEDGEGALLFQDNPVMETVTFPASVDIYLMARGAAGELRYDS